MREKFLVIYHFIMLRSKNKETEALCDGFNGLFKLSVVDRSQLQAGMYDGEMQGNPIGELQEYTQKNLLKPPAYEFIGEEGPPHAREFVCTVKLAKLQETGEWAILLSSSVGCSSRTAAIYVLHICMYVCLLCLV